MFFNSFFRYFLYLTGTKFILAPKYENGECEPSIKVLAKLIEIYCTDANYILYGKDMKVMNVSRVPENCMRDVYMLISEYLIDDYAYNENIHE